MLATWSTASGSSAFTWKMGAFVTRATSVQYGEEREYLKRVNLRNRATQKPLFLSLSHLGSVVNPIWLLATMWTVPWVEYSGSSLMWKHS